MSVNLGPRGSAPRRWAPRLAALVLVCLVAAGCGGGPPSPTRSGHPSGSATSPGHSAGPEVIARSLPRVGTVLVDGRGSALYMFVPDKRQKVTCTGVCAGTWPPLKLPAGSTAAAGPGVRASLLGSDPDPAGGRVVTYNGWPLYTYRADVYPGQTTGQGLDLNGGYWYLMRPSGQPLTSAPR